MMLARSSVAITDQSACDVLLAEFPFRALRWRARSRRPSSGRASAAGRGSRPCGAPGPHADALARGGRRRASRDDGGRAGEGRGLPVARRPCADRGRRDPCAPRRRTSWRSSPASRRARRRTGDAHPSRRPADAAIEWVGSGVGLEPARRDASQKTPPALALPPSEPSKKPPLDPKATRQLAGFICWSWRGTGCAKTPASPNWGWTSPCMTQAFEPKR